MMFRWSHYASVLLVFVVTGASGQCTVQLFTQQARACVNQFVDSYRQNPKQDCSLAYNRVKICTNRKMQECLKSHTDNSTARVIRRMSYLYIANKAFYCEDGLFKTMANYTSAHLSTCTKKFFKRIAKCRSIFLKKYRSNRGSSTLCRRYTRAKQCMYRSLRKHCKPTTRSIHSMMSAYQQKYNPYCRLRRDKGSEKAQSRGFGRCSQQGYVIKSRACITSFIHTMQQGEQSCRSTVKKILMPCIKRTVKRCLRGTRSDEQLEDDVNNSFSRRQTSIQNRFCEGGYLETIRLEEGQCTSKYFETLQGKCNSVFIAKYRENKADPRLCRDYEDVKICARNMTLTHCKLNGKQKQEMNFLYGDFNPFCPDAKDLGNGKRMLGRRGKQTTSGEKNNGAVLGRTADSILMLVGCTLFVLVRTIWG